jgi:hypothetical protein
MTRRILIALLLCGATFRAGATDYSDIWWNPAESGWGVNFAQSDKFIFATFFVYGPGNTPTWYTAQLVLDASGNFTGPLYATTGTYLGTAPFSPAQTTATQAGTATFQPTAADTGVLTYNVGNVAVAKNIQRQTLTPIPLSGSYTGGAAIDLSGCADPALNGPVSGPVDVTVTQPVPGQIRVSLSVLGIASCTFPSAGAVAQNGPLFSFPASYSCLGQAALTATVYELRATSLGIEGRWTATDTTASKAKSLGIEGRSPASDTAGCREDGRFSAVKD